MFCAADHPFLHLEKHQQTSPAVPLHECKKIIIGSAPVNLVISAENEGLSNAGQIVFTYSSRACVHRISVLLDLLAVKVKLFHWRWTSRDTWCGTNCWSGRASSTVQFRYTEVGIQTFLRTLVYTPTTSLRRFLDQPLS